MNIFFTTDLEFDNYSCGDFFVEVRGSRLVCGFSTDLEVDWFGSV